MGSLFLMSLFLSLRHRSNIFFFRDKTFPKQLIPAFLKILKLTPNKCDKSQYNSYIYIHIYRYMYIWIHSIRAKLRRNYGSRPKRNLYPWIRRETLTKAWQGTAMCVLQPTPTWVLSVLTAMWGVGRVRGHSRTLQPRVRTLGWKRGKNKWDVCSRCLCWPLLASKLLPRINCSSLPPHYPKNVLVNYCFHWPANGWGSGLNCLVFILLDSEIN